MIFDNVVRKKSRQKMVENGRGGIWIPWRAVAYVWGSF